MIFAASGVYENKKDRNAANRSCLSISVWIACGQRVPDGAGAAEEEKCVLQAGGMHMAVTQEILRRGQEGAAVVGEGAKADPAVLEDRKSVV